MRSNIQTTRALSLLLIACLRSFSLTSQHPRTLLQLLKRVSDDKPGEEAQIVFSEALLDSIWSVDLEIESRNDWLSSNAQPVDGILSVGLGEERSIPATVARQRLAALVSLLNSADIL